MSSIIVIYKEIFHFQFKFNLSSMDIKVENTTEHTVYAL